MQHNNVIDVEKSPISVPLGREASVIAVKKSPLSLNYGREASEITVESVQTILPKYYHEVNVMTASDCANKIKTEKTYQNNIIKHIQKRKKIQKWMKISTYYIVVNKSKQKIKKT